MRACDVAPIALLALALLSGCGEERHFVELDVRDRSRVPEPEGMEVQLEDERVILVEGIAISARVSAIDDAQGAMPVLSLRTSDEAVFGVEHGPKLGRFVFYGVEPGDAELEISSDGRRVGTMQVHVVAQPSPGAR